MADEMNKEREDFYAWLRTYEAEVGAVDEASAWVGFLGGRASLAASAGSEPVAWGIFDSQGFYEAAHDQGSAERFCAHYNKRKGADPLKPYTAIPLYTHPSPPEGMAGMVPVAEVVECGTMGQQTLREIDGRWRWLSIGERLYAHADTGCAAPPPPASEAKGA